MDNQKGLSFLGMLIVWVFLFPEPVHAFDPMIAAKRSLDMIKYFLIIAAVIGFIRAISKTQVLIALTIIIASVTVFAILDPITFKTVGHAVLSYLTIIGEPGPVIEPIVQPTPVP